MRFPIVIFGKIFLKMNFLIFFEFTLFLKQFDFPKNKKCIILRLEKSLEKKTIKKNLQRKIEILFLTLGSAYGLKHGQNAFILTNKNGYLIVFKKDFFHNMNGDFKYLNHFVNKLNLIYFLTFI